MVITCIDYFSKMVQLVLLRESDPRTVSGRFLSMVVSQHQLPKYIVSNHDTHFHGHFWDELFSLLDLKLTFSIA